jgi:methylglutaconyl-CoA hydratase
VTDAALYEVNGGVATITLNRPDNKNALSVDVVNAIGDHFYNAQSDDAVRAIMFTNVGNTFCAGADLKAAAPGVTQQEARHSFVEILDGMMESPKPVIGRIAGHCTGGGVGLAAACDISIAADDIIIGFTEVRIGVAPAVISVVCLPKLRRADASELFLNGERIPAERAAEVGLINRAVPRDDLDAAMDETLGKVVRGGPNALAASKQLVSKVPQMQRSEAWGWTAELSQSLFQSEEAAEGIGAFRERRDASWVPSDQ